MSVGTLQQPARRRLPTLEAGRGQALRAGLPLLALAALVVLAAVLRFYRIGHQGFWFDEANTAGDLKYSLGKMLGLLPQNETTPPLFYVIAWVWARIFGYGEAGLRALTALFGVLTVPVIYAAGAKLCSRRVGLVAAALAACNPFLVWYSQEFRPYELLVLLTAAGLLALLYARERPSGRALACWSVISAAALATHYYALVAVVPEALWLLAVHREWLARRSWRAWAVPAAVALPAVVGLALLPLAVSQNHTGNASWIAPIPLGPRLGQIIPNFLIGFQTPAQAVLLRVAEACGLLALVLLAWRASTAERRGAAIAAAIAIGGFVLNLLMIAAGIDDLITRNIIALWIPAGLVVAAGLGARRAGWLGLPLAAVLCGIGITAVIGVAVERKYQRPDWRGVARVLGPRPAPGVGTRAILVQHYHYLLPLSLNVPELKAWPRRGKVPTGAIRVRELDVVAIAAPRVALCWWGAACNLTGSEMQSSYRIPGFRVQWVRHAYQFTVMRLVASRPVALTPQAVSRALQTTTLRRDELLYQPG